MLHTETSLSDGRVGAVTHDRVSTRSSQRWDRGNRPITPGWGTDSYKISPEVVILNREFSVDYRLPAALQLALQFGMAPHAALTEALCGLEFERRLEYPRGHSICVGDRAQRPLTTEASLWPFNLRACYLVRCQRRCRLRQSSRSETSATSTRRCGNTTKRLSTN